MSEASNYTKERVERAKERIPFEKMVEAAERMVSTEVVLTGSYMGFREALEGKGLSVIGEVRMPDACMCAAEADIAPEPIADAPTADVLSITEVATADEPSIADAPTIAADASAETAASSTAVSPADASSSPDCKAASSLPSPIDQATDYEWADASAVTVPTEPRWLNGSDSDLLAIRNEISIPLVRRDFVVDAYQIYEAKHLGSDALILSASFLEESELETMLSICEELCIDALVEVHDACSLACALRAGATIVGMSLEAFKEIVANMKAASPGTPIVPEGCLLAIGPDITSADDARYAREHGADAVMLGAAFASIQDQDERQEAIRAISEIE